MPRMKGMSSLNVPIRASDAEALKAAAVADQRTVASLLRKIIADWVAGEGRALLDRPQTETNPV
jgi:hypothetical protein